jgi:hypothetical protein
MLDGDAAANLKSAYEQLCTSYRAIDDFRAKLLGFLPLATGGVVLLLVDERLDKASALLLPAGMFGVAVTSGLLAYELYGIRKCHALLMAGEELEEAMGLPQDDTGRPAGQFLRRPNHLLGIVNEPFAAAAIYPAVLAAWAFLALLSVQPTMAGIAGLTVFLVGFVGILLYDQSLKRTSLLRKMIGRLSGRSFRKQFQSGP